MSPPQPQPQPQEPEGKLVSLWFLFQTFLKIGCIAFGGFTALIAVVENDMVRKRKLLHTEDMLDGISLAMLLPGPIAVNVVAFVGYRLRGGLGALVSATGVILPSFFLLVSLSHVYFNYGEIPTVSKVFAAAVVIGQGCQFHWVTLIVFIGCMVALIRFRIDIVWIIPSAGLMGLLLY